MGFVQNTYRLSIRAIPVILCSALGACFANAGDTSNVKAAAPAAPADSAIAQRQTASATKMMDSIAKQKAAAQEQLGGPPAADSFFATGWTTVAALPMPSVVPGCTSMAEDELKPLIADSAKTEDLKPELIRSVIRHESDSYPCAVSLKGALGLMQLMPEVAQQFGVDPLDPRQNVSAGAKYLKQLLGRYKGDLKLALAAYNAGPQRVDAEQKVPAIAETTAYVDAILKDLKPNQTKVR